MKKILLFFLIFPSSSYSSALVSDNKSLFVEDMASQCAKIQYQLEYYPIYHSEKPIQYTYNDLQNCLNIYQQQGGRMDLYQSIYQKAQNAAYYGYQKCLDDTLKKKNGLSFLCSLFHDLHYELTITFICCPEVHKGYEINVDNFSYFSEKCMQQCHGECICYK